MTKKDFEQLAAFVRSDGIHAGFAHNIAHARFAAELADELKSNHARFDKARFIKACMPTWLVGTRGEQAWDREVREHTNHTAL
jgi:hypothetical protein